jgi:hypothetical protein
MNWLAKVRPQVLVAILILGTIAIIGLQTDPAMPEVSGVAVAGLIALSKDILNHPD